MLHQLVYLSKATRKYDEADLVRLCKRSFARNEKLDVTGLLLFDGSRFIQALEGPEAAVRAVMSRIAKDTGHTDIDIAADKPVAERQFGDWSMDYKHARSGCCSREFLDKVKSDVSNVDDLEMKAVFIGFAVLGSQGPIGYRCGAASD